MHPICKNLIQAYAIVILAYFTGQLIPKLQEITLKLDTPAIVTEPPNVVSSIPTVGYAELKTANQERATILIDARASHAYKTGHLPKAINIPATVGDLFIQKFLLKVKNPARMIIVYCSDANCQDSQKLADKIKAGGHQNIAIYKEGWEEWKLLEATN
jgi:3-mercaptopyruvate sulfurtransferase SseA